MGIDGDEESFSQIIYVQQVREFPQGRRIGCCHPVWVDFNESASAWPSHMAS